MPGLAFPPARYHLPTMMAEMTIFLAVTLNWRAEAIPAAGLQGMVIADIPAAGLRDMVIADIPAGGLRDMVIGDIPAGGLRDMVIEAIPAEAIPAEVTPAIGTVMAGIMVTIIITMATMVITMDIRGIIWDGTCSLLSGHFLGWAMAMATATPTTTLITEAEITVEATTLPLRKITVRERITAVPTITLPGKTTTASAIIKPIRRTDRQRTGSRPTTSGPFTKNAPTKLKKEGSSPSSLIRKINRSTAPVREVAARNNSDIFCTFNRSLY